MYSGNFNAGELVGFISDWVQGGASIVADGTRLAVLHGPDTANLFTYPISTLARTANVIFSSSSQPVRYSSVLKREDSMSESVVGCAIGQG